ncbi:hypothetical protein [Methyloversatilis sp.]|mgnify:FL=1|jgi:hypothetical protein|uniref:hypothetical protein n=1 Tax=Methyloversatilis sp. TaxID=2569862 RepID=UPI001A3898FB|nr:hypothetical protein [Methyloversatilis sp.]MBL8476618.1 hypothetical protein [Methyloversatilis sp.]
MKFLLSLLACCCMLSPAIAQTPAQTAFLKAETRRIEDQFVRRIVDITRLPDAQVRSAMPAEGRITDPAARVVAAIEQQRGQPLSDAQKQAIAQADEERRSALVAARAAAKDK